MVCGRGGGPCDLVTTLSSLGNQLSDVLLANWHDMMSPMELGLG